MICDGDDEHTTNTNAQINITTIGARDAHASQALAWYVCYSMYILFFFVPTDLQIECVSEQEQHQGFRVPQ